MIDIAPSDIRGIVNSYGDLPTKVGRALIFSLENSLIVDISLFLHYFSRLFLKAGQNVEHAIFQSRNDVVFYFNYEVFLSKFS